jgi:hypothetical protein
LNPFLLERQTSASAAHGFPQQQVARLRCTPRSGPELARAEQMKLKPDAFACTVLTAVKLLGWKNKAKRNLKAAAAAADAAPSASADAAATADAGSPAKLRPLAAAPTKLLIMKQQATTDAKMMVNSNDRELLESIVGTGTASPPKGDRAAAGVLAAMQSKPASGPSANSIMVEKARKRIEKSQKGSAPFKGIVGKFWAVRSRSPLCPASTCFPSFELHSERVASF